MAFGGFSWKRASGFTNLKRKIGKVTGFLLTKQGRKQKVNRMITKTVTGRLAK